MIELPEGLVIISDEHCYIVGNPRKSRGKGVEIKNPKYYAHIDQAIQGALALILRLKVKNKEITTLRQFLDEQASLNQELRDMLTPQNSGGEAVETRGDETATVAEGNFTYLTRQKGKNAMYRPMRQNKPRRVIHDVAELPVLCDCAEAGLLLRRNPEVIAKMAKEDVLKGAKQGQSWFFRRDDLVEYMDKLFETGGTGAEYESR